MAGMDFISATRSQNEKIVDIVKTGACGTDAIQVITGFIVGKGNLIFKNYGETAFKICAMSPMTYRIPI